jgi:hypothetical protein
MPVSFDTSEATAALARLNSAIGAHLQYSRQAPAEAVAKKAQQILLGVGIKGDRKPGLFDRFADTAPRKGSITAGRQADSWQVGRKNSRSLTWARAKAQEILAGRRSAPVRMVEGEAGGVKYIGSIQAGAVMTRGKHKGLLRFGSRSKTLRTAYRTSRAAARAAGGVLLNEQALTAALTVQRRERSRLATAAQVLPRRYRTVLQRLAGRKYRSGQLVGVSSTDAAMMQEHKRITIENKKGRTLGSLEVGGFVGASIRIRGELGLHTREQVQGLVTVLDDATADTLAYVTRKQKEELDRALAKAARRGT